MFLGPGPSPQPLPTLSCGVGPPSQVAQAWGRRVLAMFSGFGLKTTSPSQGVRTPGHYFCRCSLPCGFGQVHSLTWTIACPPPVSAPKQDPCHRCWWMPDNCPSGLALLTTPFLQGSPLFIQALCPWSAAWDHGDKWVLFPPDMSNFFGPFEGLLGLEFCLVIFSSLPFPPLPTGIPPLVAVGPHIM